MFILFLNDGNNVIVHNSIQCICSCWLPILVQGRRAFGHYTRVLGLNEASDTEDATYLVCQSLYVMCEKLCLHL